MQFAGLPWRTDIHDALLTSELGPRVAYGTRPAKLEALATRIRTLLQDPTLNPDSQAEVLRALKRVGLPVRSTRAWELKEHSHPALVPLLEYKKLSRLLSANGWFWMDTWIVNGRFHPDYVPGGVVTGRWATKGGGALQLPKQVRRAVTADDGWKLVVADASQLEPRILAALSTDLAMANAGRGTDLYAGIVASGVVETRDHAKVAMLGAMYGATTGESGRLLPKLARAYPRALELTEAAARVGERGGVVTTRLGRSSPRPSEDWLRAQAYAYEPEASSADERMARSQSLGDRSGAFVEITAWTRSARVRSESGISAIAARTAFLSSAFLSAFRPRRFSALSSAARSFMAARSSAENPSAGSLFALVVVSDVCLSVIAALLVSTRGAWVAGGALVVGGACVVGDALEVRRNGATTSTS